MDFWTITAILLCQVVCEYIDVYYIPCVDVLWLEPRAFQEELVKSPTFHNFADPILHNIVVKDIFAWVYLVCTEQITNRMSLQIIEIGYNSSVMDRDWYSGNYLFNVEVGNWEEEEKQKTILCGVGGGGGGGHPTQLLPWDTLRDDEPPALLSLACMFGEALKTNDKESYDSKIEVSDIGIPDTPSYSCIWSTGIFRNCTILCNTGLVFWLHQCSQSHYWASKNEKAIPSTIHFSRWQSFWMLLYFADNWTITLRTTLLSLVNNCKYINFFFFICVWTSLAHLCFIYLFSM